MQEVSLVFEENIHPGSSHTEDIPGVLINVTLQIQDLLIAGLLGKSTSHLVGLMLESQSSGVGIFFLAAKEKGSNLCEVLWVQSLVKIRELSICLSGLPRPPNGVIIDGHRDPLFAVEREMLESIEKGPGPCGLSRTDAFQGRHLLLGHDVVHAQHEDKPLAPSVPAGRRYSQRDCMAHWDVKGRLSCPQPFILESAHAPFLDVEDGLNHASLPKLRLRACCKPLLPLIRQVLDLALPESTLPQQMDESEFVTTKGAVALLPVKGALMKSSQGGSIVTIIHLLQCETDLPI